MSRFSLQETGISGVGVATRDEFRDDRGSFSRLFCEGDLGFLFGDRALSQINLSVTKGKGVVRGMHYQNPPHAECKLVSCLRGEVWDVALDLRAESGTFLQWHAEKLTPENRKALFIPEGVAHGFQTLSDDVEILYCHTEAYAPESEGAVHPLEERVGIEWPLPISFLSDRDSSHPRLSSSFTGLVI